MVDDAIVSAAAGVLGALVGGGAAILAARFTVRQTETAAIAKETRDRKRQTEDAITKGRIEAATSIIGDLQEMRDVWSGDRTSVSSEGERVGRLWDLHEQVRVQTLILPADLRKDLAVLNRCLRFADEIGGSDFRPSGFIFLGTTRVAQVAFEAAQEQLSRFIAGDAAVPWPPDALRLRAAHDDLMGERSVEYAQEAHEYESERKEFDEAHPPLADHVHNAKQLRGSSED